MFWLHVCCLSLILVNLIIPVIHGFDVKAFDDTVLFKINWPGNSETNFLEPHANVEPYTITTANNEKYQCFIPEVVGEEVSHEDEYTGPNPIEFLYLLFNQNQCSYRLESYWTYELCHGRYVQQYHEERDGKKVKVQKYELGKMDMFQIKKLSDKYDEFAKNPNRKSEIPVKKIDGVNMPYVEMEMTDGTLCDLNNKPRSIKVLYVCFQQGKQEIHSIKETATCEYEAVVLTPLLCGHPDYKPQDTGESHIHCIPLDNSPLKPRSLMALEAESSKLKYQKVTDEKPQKVYAIFRLDKDGQDGPPQIRMEIHPFESNDKNDYIETSMHSLAGHVSSLVKSNSVEHFLNGRNCLNGGNGWWKYEFCYGRTVTQYHIESGGAKTVVSLGVFNKEKHMEWIDANPLKKPKPIGQRKQLSHFYSYGTVCDKTGKPRQTEVKLKCVSNSVGGPSSVSLYLMEPTMCEYVLGVESPLICDILEHADDAYGIINDKILENLEEMKTSLHVEDDDERIANGDD